jgi:hypothetical protein
MTGTAGSSGGLGSSSAFSERGDRQQRSRTMSPAAAVAEFLTLYWYNFVKISSNLFYG